MSQAFRQLVRDELSHWLGQQRAVFDTLAERLADAIVPSVAEEIRRSLMVRLGELQPDERALVGELLADIRQTLVVVPASERLPQLKLDHTRGRINAILLALEGYRDQARRDPFEEVQP